MEIYIKKLVAPSANRACAKGKPSPMVQGFQPLGTLVTVRLVQANACLRQAHNAKHVSGTSCNGGRGCH